MTVALTETLEADVSAIAAAMLEDDDHLRVVALHAPGIPRRRSPEITISKQDLSLLAARQPDTSSERAESASEQRRLQEDAAARVSASLGLDHTGPLLTRLLSVGGTVIGALLAGNPVSQRAWEAGERRVLEALGPDVAAALAGVRRHHETESDRELRTSRRRQAELARRVTELEQQAKTHQAEIAAVAAGRDTYRERAELLAAKVRQYEQQGDGEQGSRGDVTGAVDLFAVLVDTLNTLEPLMHERRLAAKLDAKPGGPAVAAGRAGATRIVTGLLLAVQVSAQHGSEIVVRSRPVTTDEDAELPLNSVLVTVSYRESSPQAMDETFSAELSDARNLIQSLGGLVWMEREPAGRTTFSFTLPVASDAGG
jgi:hypothetical protein